MNGFTATELDAIVAIIEDAYPILDIMKRRTGASVEQVRAVYASIGAKARQGFDEMRKAEQMKAKEEESKPKLVE